MSTDTSRGSPGDTTLYSRDEFPSKELIECPWPTLARMREETPVYPLEGQPGMIVITRYGDIREALADWTGPLSSHGSRSAFLGANVLLGEGTKSLPVFETDGEEHAQKRKILFQPVKPGQLKGYETLITRLSDQLIDAFVDEGRVEFVSVFAAELPALVTCHVLGVPETDAHLFREWGKLETGSLPWLDDEFKARQLARAGRMNDYLTELVLERRNSLGTDGLSLVIKEQMSQHGEFNLDECRTALGPLIAGGVITTAHMLSSVFYYLLTHADVMARVKADPALIVRVVEETLRLEPPVMWSPRKVVKNGEVGGCPVHDGSIALMMYASANRDLSVFDAPDEFDVDRRNVNDHFAFGHGEHFCPGAPLARMEGRIGFGRLLERLPNTRLVDASVQHVPSLQFRGLTELHIEFG